MKKMILLLTLFSFLTTTTIMAIPNRPVVEDKEIISAKALKKNQKEVNKQAKKKAKFQKKIQKLKTKIDKRLAKKGITKTQANSVWNDETFKLGALVALGGLLLTILGILPILGGIFSFIGGLMMIVGVGLMIWVLIENY